MAIGVEVESQGVRESESACGERDLLECERVRVRVCAWCVRGDGDGDGDRRRGQVAGSPRVRVRMPRRGSARVGARECAYACACACAATAIAIGIEVKSQGVRESESACGETALQGQMRMREREQCARVCACACVCACVRVDGGQYRRRGKGTAGDGEDGDGELCTYLSGWESSPSGGGWSASECTATTVGAGLKFQRKTWIRRTIHVSVLRTSYTDTKNDGTHRVVVDAVLTNTPPVVLMRGRPRCTGGVDALAVVNGVRGCCRGVSGGV